MTGGECLVVRRVGEEGRHGVHGSAAFGGLLQLFQQFLEGVTGIVLGAEGSADGGEAVTVLGEDGVVTVQLQGLHESFPQPHEEGQGTAQEDDLALELTALGEACHGLVHHSLEDGGRHVLLPAALVQDGLDVALGEDAAAGGDGVDLLVAQGEGVQLRDGDVQQGGHLIDEGTGAAGAGAVHTLLDGAAEEDDLGILAPQLDDRIGAGDEGSDGSSGGIDLLDKVQTGGLGHAQTGRAGDEELNVLAAEHVGQLTEGLAGPLTGLGVVALVGAEK